MYNYHLNTMPIHDHHKRLIYKKPPCGKIPHGSYTSLLNVNANDNDNGKFHCCGDNDNGIGDKLASKSMVRY